MKRINLLIGILSISILSIVLISNGLSNFASAQESTGSTIFLPIIVNNSSQVDSTAIVRLSKIAFNQVAALIQPMYIIDYESFVWLKISNQDLSILEISGVEYEIQQEATLLLLNRFQFDPLEGEPKIPSEQLTSYTPGEEGFHLVQFFGPTKDEWLERMETVGVITIQFQPSFAYIVRMTSEEAALVDEEDFSRWVGVYHAAYRIAPSLLEPLVPGPEAVQQEVIENVDVTIYNNGQVQQTINAIQEKGGEFIQQYPADPDGSLVSAIFALPSDSLVDVAQMNNVLWMNFISPEPGLDDEVSDQIVAGNQVGGTPFTGYNAWLTSSGVSGTGVTVALVDTGMDTNNNATAHLDIRGRIAAFVGYPGAPATDTNGHGTNVGGIIAGNASIGTVDANGFLYGMGVAPNAQLVVQNALSGSSWPPIGGWQTLSRASVINGAIASNNSWWTTSTTTPGYTVAERTHDILVRDADWTTAAVAEPLIMVFSAGNSGPGASTITEPKEAKNLIVVGASENFRSDPWVAAARATLTGIGSSPNACGNPININNMVGFSSRGPALDGRILPNVTAPGSYIASLRSATGTFGIVATGFCNGIIDANYVWYSGTSQAAPHVTGAVALITEWWRTFNGGANPTPAMAKALLINGAVDMGTADIPNNNEGWGRVNLNNVINPSVPVIYQDQVTTFGSSGQTWSLSVGPDDPTQPLKVSLVWTDAPGPGTAGATAALVNDLDLSVAQGGSLFRGNVFVNGWSTTGGAADRQNNVENVYFQNPSGGYDITVNAFNIGGDGVPFNGDITDQDFALVCYNCKLASDLSITKSDSPDPAVAGGILTYTIGVSNSGPGEAESVEIKDTLPTEVTFLPASSSPSCGLVGSDVTCTLGNIPNGGTSSVTIAVQIDADLVFNTGGPVTITNNASVSSLTPDSDTSNNSISEDTLVVAEADLAIVSFTPVDPPNEVLVGEDVTITLQKFITNNGPSAPIDAQLTKMASPPPSSIVTPMNVSENQSALGLGEMRSVDEDFTINCGAPGDQTFTFTNEIQPLHAADSDPNPSNNTAQVNLQVECIVPVAINIKPGSYPNSINPDSRDVIPVAVLSTLAGEYSLPLAFDATSIDPLSVRFGPYDEVWNETDGAFEAHNRGHLEDSYELDEVTHDGDIDMVLHFHTRETGISSSDTQACVKGEWMDATNNILKFFGCDSIRTVPSTTP